MMAREEENEQFCKLLLKCPIERLDKIVHHLVDLFCGQKRAIYEEFSDVWSLMEWWDLEHSSQTFLIYYYEKNDEVLDGSSLSAELKKVLSECLEIRKLDIKNSLVDKTHTISPCYLADFDWKLRLSLSSDKMAQINEPRLLLDLELSGNIEQSLNLDLSKDELKSLIDSMEKAKKALDEVIIPD